MKIELKDTTWLIDMFSEIIGKDVEHDDLRGPIGKIRVDGPTVIINLSWWATYDSECWVKRGDQLTIQFLNPKIELLDSKMIRLTSSNKYCVIFFGFDSINPQVPANN